MAKYLGNRPTAVPLTSADIQDEVITAADLAANSVDSSELVDGSIDTSHIGALQVTEAKIAADAITGAKIADDAIDSEHYTDGSIDNAHIADDAIDSEHYADGSIDLAHMSSESVDEDNLHISNAGSNGEFLSKQSGNSGGLTWAAAGSSTTNGAVGTYAMVTKVMSSNNTWEYFGNTTSGGNIVPSGYWSAGKWTTNSSSNKIITDGSLSGTWRIMGAMHRKSSGNSPYYVTFSFTLACRVS